MKLTLTKSMFIDYFRNSSRAESFTYPALEALYDYYESIDKEWELDIIQICCEWTECDSIEDACQDYCVQNSEELESHTLVIYLNDGGCLVENY